MAEGAKNLDELFYFAQNLLKEVETKKKELSGQESERGQSFLGLSSFRDRRDKALRYREWKQKFCNLANRSNLAKSVDKVKDLEIKWSEQKKTQLMETHQSLSGYQRFLSTNDGDRNSHWENTLSSFTQESYPNMIRKAIQRTKSQDPSHSKPCADEKFYFLFGDKETPPLEETSSPVPIKNTYINKRESVNDSENSLVDESHNYRSTNPSPKAKVIPKEIIVQKSPFAKKRPVSSNAISSDSHNNTSSNHNNTLSHIQNRSSQNISPETPQRTTKKRITEMSPHRRDFLKRSFPETPKKVTTVTELLKGKTVHIPSSSSMPWNTPQSAKKTEVPASFRASIRTIRKENPSPAQSSRVEGRPRSASIKDQIPLSAKTNKEGSKTPLANSSKEKSPGKDGLFSNSFQDTKQQLGTILEKRKLVESLRVKSKGIETPTHQPQSSSRASNLNNIFPLQSSRNSIRLPNGGGDNSPTKILRTTTSITFQEPNKTRENTLNDEASPTSTASPNISQIKIKEVEIRRPNNIRDRKNLRSNSCQNTKGGPAKDSRDMSDSPELPRKATPNNGSYLKKGNSFKGPQTATSKKNLLKKASLIVDRNSSEPIKNIKEVLTPNKQQISNETMKKGNSKTNILKFEKEKLIQDMMIKLNSEKHKKGTKVK